MTTRIELINRALERIGAGALQSESAPNADKLIRLYEDQLALLIGFKPWTWMRETVQCGRDLEAPPHPFWKYRYSLPTTRLGPPDAVFDKPRSLAMRAGGDPFTDFEYDGPHLVTDAEVIFVRVRMRKDVSQWPPLFRECQIRLVAGEAALMMHEDMKTRLQFVREVLGDERVPGDLGLIGKAATIDAQSHPSDIIMDEGGPLIDVRF